jgi:dihydroorotase
MLDLAKENGLNITRIVQLMCHNPADLFRIDKRGYLKEGYYADLAIVNPSKPTIVKKEKILSKCAWSPFEEIAFKSSVSHTFVNGILNYHNGEILGPNSGQRLVFMRK